MNIQFSLHYQQIQHLCDTYKCTPTHVEKALKRYFQGVTENINN